RASSRCRWAARAPGSPPARTCSRARASTARAASTASGSSAARASSSTDGRSRSRTTTSLEPVQRSAAGADEAVMDAAAGPLVRARHDLDRDRPDRALDALSKVTEPELETYEFWTLRARALYRLRRWEEALEAAQTGLERRPDDFQLLDVLALAHLESGHKKQARTTIEHALELYPDQAVLHAHRALILARMKPRSFRLAAYKDARAAVDEALRLDPHSDAALRVRAQVAT